MFGLFKKNKKSSDVVIKTAVGLINFQLSATNTTDDVTNIINEYCRGYIFGLCDSLLQTLKTDDVESMAALTVIHVRLFGEEEGSKMLKNSFQDQNNKEFKKGQMKGGQDFIESINSNNPPLGLADYLSNSGLNIENSTSKVVACKP